MVKYILSSKNFAEKKPMSSISCTQDPWQLVMQQHKYRGNSKVQYLKEKSWNTMQIHCTTVSGGYK